jgi:RsiW-degrading membrane proteinase PrsW (M82 family)
MGNFGLNKETLSAIIGGLMPAIAWLIFWVKSETINSNRESYGLILITFIVGMMSVLFAIPIERIIEMFINNEDMLTLTWAFAEEVLKFIAVMISVGHSSYLNEPIDFAMYLIAGALGFAGLENVLFLMNPDIVSNSHVSLLTGNLRFLGSTLLHAVSTGLIGIGMGLSFYQNWKNKWLYILGGLMAATALHSIFNLFIIHTENQQFFRVFGFLWVVTIISILLFEKLRRLGSIIEAD